MNARRAGQTSLVAIVVLLAACSPSTPSAMSTPIPEASPLSAGRTQTSDGGQVTVVVEWAGPAAGAVFDVTLDTHSVDLDALDLADAVLRNDRAATLGARPWAAPKGGHHRAGPLTFEGDAARLLEGATWIELVVKGVGDLPERTLRWEVGS